MQLIICYFLYCLNSVAENRCKILQSQVVCVPVIFKNRMGYQPYQHTLKLIRIVNFILLKFVPEENLNNITM